MKRKTAHIISHSHWDREWYMPFEKHRVRLVSLIDEVIALLEQDRGFRSFHLDGQTIVLEDYLQVRPEMKGKLQQLIKEKKLMIGPWYILQDEFLTSAESNIRNLLIGLRDAREFGGYCNIGYFPDSFGNMGQAPQILQQAGIETAVFGRGVKPVGFDNTVQNQEEYESTFSEMIWESPDGSRVLGILFANWYHNGMEIPVDEEEAAAYWKSKIASAASFASTGQLLFMNGCDHQPVQKNLTQALETARKVADHVEFTHSNFEDYIRAVQGELPAELSLVKGELRSQRSDGWTTLVNTASSRIYLKQANQQAQTLLEKVAEPLSTFAHLCGLPYPHHLFVFAWKTLMQNHPHDSICGCSIDEVHQEMKLRFDKTKYLCDELIRESTDYLASQIDTSFFRKFGTSVFPFTVFNTTGWKRTGTVNVELELKKLYFRAGTSPAELAKQLEDLKLLDSYLVDHTGRALNFNVEDMGVTFGYELPNDKFRQPYMVRKVKLTFEAEAVPALGYKTFAWVHSAQASDFLEPASLLVVDERTLENDFLHIAIADNGSLTLLDKFTNRTYTGLCVYENVGDIGNEYMFKQPEGEKPLTTIDLHAEISVLENTPYRAALGIVHRWEIPASADKLLDEEIRYMIPYKDRKSLRAKETISMVIQTEVILEKHSRMVQVKTTFDNQAKDHRLRVLFPTDLETDSVQTDSIFEVVTRPIQPAPEWKNPSNCQHQQAFVSLSNGAAGLTLANKGLHEYEVLLDGRNTIAITLLRAIGELGDWGVFRTPEAQCLGKHVVEFAIIPHQDDVVVSGAFAEAYQHQVPWTVNPTPTNLQTGTMAPEYSFLNWEGDSLAFSAFKISEETGDVIARWFNTSNEATRLVIQPSTDFDRVYMSNVIEQHANDIVDQSQEILLPIRPAQIVTVGFHSDLEKRITHG